MFAKEPCLQFDAAQEALGLPNDQLRSTGGSSGFPPQRLSVTLRTCPRVDTETGELTETRQFRRQARARDKADMTRFL
jgi:hypothetical protein